MPVRYHIDRDAKAVVFVATGEAGDRELWAARDEGLAARPGFGELIDLRAATRFAVSPQSMSLLTRGEAARGTVPSRIAIVSRESGREGNEQPLELIGGLLSYALSRDRPRSEIRIFQEVEEAREWLAAGLDVTSRPTTQMPSIGAEPARAATALQVIVDVFAEGIVAADALRPRAKSVRSRKPFRPGIGPHSERQAIDLVTEQMMRLRPTEFASRLAPQVPYPAAPRSRCDLCVGTRPRWEWAMELKMLRFLGDNGKPHDNILLHILSPYRSHRSALTDCEKLTESGFECRKAILIYGFDHDEWPLDPAIEAFEQLARHRVDLGDRTTAKFDRLVNPVHSRGRVFGWEIRGRSR